MKRKPSKNASMHGKASFNKRQYLTVMFWILMIFNFFYQNAITQCITPPTGMVAWWPGDNITNDISGYNNNGTLQGGTTYTIGKVNNAFSVQASANFIKVLNSSSLNFDTLQNFSIDAWIHTTDSVRATIIDKRTGTEANPTGYALFVINGKLGFQLGDGSPFSNNMSTSPIINNGSWHHVAATINRASATGGRLYVDGVLVFVFDPTAHPGNISSTADLWIGQHQISSVQTYEGFQGGIDEVEIFNRALNATEVYNIWAADTCGKCKTDTLIGSLCGFKFNDVNSNCIMDSLEQGLAGWTINLSGPVSLSTTTDAFGQYCFDSIPAGTYTVSEVLQSGWIQTCPSTPGTYVVTLSPGQNINNLIFGNKMCTSCCDSLIVTPAVSTCPNASGKTFTIISNVTPPSPITSIYIIPTPSIPPSSLCGTDLSVDGIPTLWSSPYNIIGPISATINVAFTLGIANSLGWNGTIRLYVLHADGDTCSFVYSWNTTGIDRRTGIPTDFALLQNSPNPFNPTTTIEYHLPVSTFVKMSVFDISGREIAVLVNENKSAGKYRITFDASNLTTGIYFYRIQAGQFQATCKLILLK